jgi:sirohydrochlorin cobaltochelatase
VNPALLIVGHGSSDTVGAQEFRAFTERVGKRMEARDVAVAGGFIELSPPPLTDAVRVLVGRGHRRIAAIPLMLVAAGHAKGDVPAALARERERHSGLTVAYGRPLGPHPSVLSLLRERLSGLDGGTVLLVGRGSTDPDANAEVAKVARLLAETAGVDGVEYSFISLAAPRVADGLERCRRLGATRIAVLPYFLFPGVLPDRVKSQATAWAAEHPEVEVRQAAVLGDTETLADMVVERYDEALSGDIRMNCDTCIYRVPLPNFESRVGAAQRPHHHPHDHHH